MTVYLQYIGTQYLQSTQLKFISEVLMFDTSSSHCQHVKAAA